MPVKLVSGARRRYTEERERGVTELGKPTSGILTQHGASAELKEETEHEQTTRFCHSGNS